MLKKKFGDVSMTMPMHAHFMWTFLLVWFHIPDMCMITACMEQTAFVRTCYPYERNVLKISEPNRLQKFALPKIRQVSSNFVVVRFIQQIVTS